MQSQAERNCISNPEQEERRQGRSDQTSQSGQSHVLTSVGFTAHSLLASRKQGRRLPRAVRPSRLRLLDTLLPFLRSHSAVYPLKADKDTSQLAAQAAHSANCLSLRGATGRKEQYDEPAGTATPSGLRVPGGKGSQSPPSHRLGHNTHKRGALRK